MWQSHDIFTYFQAETHIYILLFIREHLLLFINVVKISEKLQVALQSPFKISCPILFVIVSFAELVGREGIITFSRKNILAYF